MSISNVTPSEKARAMRFSWLTGDCDWKDYWGQWVSKKFNNGDFDYWLVLSFRNIDECGPNGEKYMCELCCVIPSEVSDEDMAQYKRSADFASWGDEGNWRHIIEVLMTNGAYVSFGEMYGDNADKLRRAVAVRAVAAAGLFGFFMDAPQNRLGATGWDIARGNVWGTR